MSDLTIIRKPSRWFTFRDGVIFSLAVAVALFGVVVLVLAVQVNSLSQELGRRPTAAQFAALTDQIEQKDARIKQLTDLLIRKGIPVPPAPVPSLLPRPQPTPSLTPSPPVSGPRPTPGRSPSQRPTRTPAPSPTCLVFVAGTCLTPPPAPTPSLPFI